MKYLISILACALLGSAAFAANELEHIDTHSLTIYAKPTPIVPVTWGDDVVTMTEVETNTGYYAADVSTPDVSYVVYQQVGGSPDIGDTKLAIISVPYVNVRKWNGTNVDPLTTAAEINAEVDTALNTAIPGSPTAHSINQRIAAIDDLTQASGSGDLAAILLDTIQIQAALAIIDAIVDTISAATGAGDSLID